MGIINSILGNASEINTVEIQKEYDSLLCTGESIEGVFFTLN